MYVQLKSSKQSRNKTLQIVRGIREGKKVKQQVIASLGIIEDKNNLKKLLKLAENLIRKIDELWIKSPAKIDLANLLHTTTVYDGFGMVVSQMMQLTRFSKILATAQGKRKFDLEEAVKLIITQRWALPSSSKLPTYQRQNEQGFEGVDLQNIYHAMDAIEPLEKSIQAKAFHTARSTSHSLIDSLFLM